VVVWQQEGGGRMRVKVILRDRTERKLVKAIVQVCKNIKIMINYK
jgi:hypothetical protein